MHNIWNPWHGCKKISEGCENCYMYYLDRMRDKDGSYIYQTGSFYYPLKKDRKGNYKIKSGETLGTIAAKYGVRIKDIQSWNGLRNTKIAAGKQLKIYK